tara:strand:+ start:84 stop:725 length:642 start_codon:yes stop_codon:yes gene_type:complete
MAKKAFISASKPVVTVNAKELLRELTSDRPNNKSMAKALRNIIGPKIEERQKELTKEFSSHPITIELNAGPRATNTSGTLGGYGNLFSFIGFESGSNPTGVIERIFKEKIKFTIRRVGSSGRYNITFHIPSLDEIYGLTPIPWLSGKSWAKSIEEGGLSNLGQYMYSSTGFGTSRSNTGIQATNKSSSVSFTRTPYVGKLIQNFKNRLLRLDG